MKQSSFLLVDLAENLRYFMFADLEVGCRWGARDAISVTEVASSLFAAEGVSVAKGSRRGDR